MAVITVPDPLCFELRFDLAGNQDGDRNGGEEARAEEHPRERSGGAAAASHPCDDAEIDVEDRPGNDSNERGHDVLPEWEVGDAEEVVLKLERHQRAEPTQDDDLPALFPYGLGDRRRRSRCAMRAPVAFPFTATVRNPESSAPRSPSHAHHRPAKRRQSREARRGYESRDRACRASAPCAGRTGCTRRPAYQKPKRRKRPTRSMIGS